MPVGWDFLFFGATTSLVCFALWMIVHSGAWRSYPFLLLYLSAGLISQGVEMFVLSRTHTTATLSYALAYWTFDLVLHGLIIALLLFLMREALNGRSGFDRTGLLIIAVVGLLVALALYMLFGPTKGWVNPLSRDLSFCEEILNLVLWTILLRNRTRDIVLLLVSAGVGIQVTGEVIGHTLRLVTESRTLVWLPTSILLLCETGALLVWCKAFLTFGRRQRAAETGIQPVPNIRPVPPGNAPSQSRP